MSDTTDLCLQALKVEEGFRPHVYKDSVGLLTIGYGCNLNAGWSEGLASHVLRYQAEAAEIDLGVLPWYDQLDLPRRAVLLDMAFNMGVQTLLTFKNTLGAVQRGDWQAAHDGMLASKWARQVGPRAQRLAKVMLTGVWE